MGVFRMACFLRYCVFGLLSLSVLTAEASRQKPVVRPASAQDVFVKGGTTLDIDRHWGEILDVPGGRVNLPVTQKSAYNPARIAGAIKQLIKNNPLKVAGTAAGLYLIHQLPGANFDSVTGQPVKTPDSPPTGTYWTAYIYNGASQPFADVRKATYQDACKLVMGTPAESWHWQPRYVKVGNDYDCYRNYSAQYCPSCGNQLQAQAIYNTINCPTFGFDKSTSTCRTSKVSPVPLTDSELDSISSTPLNESHWQELGPELLADIPATFDGPDFQEFTGLDQVTGTPTITTTLDQVSGTTTVVESTPVHSFDYSTNPLSITTTTTVTNNTYQNGTLVSTTTQTQGQPSTEVSEVPAQLEIPTDCDFMPTVCSFIDWVKTPFNEEEPDLSELIADEDFEQEINFSSNATCPGPSMISTSQGDFEFSWEPGCQWAVMIKPLIIIAALVAAIFINLGTARGPE